MVNFKIRMLGWSVGLSLFILSANNVFAQQENKGPDSEKKAEEAVVDELDFRDMDMADVLKVLAQKSGLNIIAGNEVRGKVTIYLKNVRLLDVLRIILDANELACHLEDKTVQIMPAKEFETKYGYKFGGNMQTKIIHLAYAGAEEAAAVLNQVKSPSGRIIADSKSGTVVLTDTPEKIRFMEQLIEKMDVAVFSKVFDLSYASAKEVAQKIEPLATKNLGQVHFDERSNKLVVTDTAAKIKEIARLVESFDVQEKEVLIEAKIVQVILSDGCKFGIDWEGLVARYHHLNLVSDFAILNGNSKSGRVRVGSLADDDYTALLEALETVGETNILSSPRITAINNHEAKILVGSTEPYVTTTTTTTSAGPATTAESVNFIEVGVKLYVTPQIHHDGFVTLKIKPEVSAVTSTLTTANNNTIPVVESSQAETTVSVKDGVTIVIGGLIKEEWVRAVNKVPLLGDVPLLGYAFRSSDKVKKKTEIVIFLTPKIISGDSPALEEVPLNRRPDDPKAHVEK